MAGIGVGVNRDPLFQSTEPTLILPHQLLLPLFVWIRVIRGQSSGGRAHESHESARMPKYWMGRRDWKVWGWHRGWGER